MVDIISFKDLKIGDLVYVPGEFQTFGFVSKRYNDYSLEEDKKYGCRGAGDYSMFKLSALDPNSSDQNFRKNLRLGVGYLLGNINEDIAREQKFNVLRILKAGETINDSCLKEISSYGTKRCFSNEPILWQTAEQKIAGITECYWNEFDEICVPTESINITSRRSFNSRNLELNNFSHFVRFKFPKKLDPSNYVLDDLLA